MYESKKDETVDLAAQINIGFTRINDSLDRLTTVLLRILAAIARRSEY